MIDIGSCVFTLLNTYYLPHYSNYQINDNLHEALIYGYNQDEEIFYFADNMKGGRYSHAEISFKELLRLKKVF